MFRFTSLNGHCFGAQNLAGEIGSGAEAVTIRHWKCGGVSAQLHVLGLDNDIEDDFYLHSFQVPNARQL